MDEKNQKSGKRDDIQYSASRKSRTPVLDNFSISFKLLIQKDLDAGLTYFYRENELSAFYKTLLKKDKPHIALIGEEGTGRETLIKSAVHKILRGDPGILFNLLPLKLDFDSIISGTKYRGQFEERMKAICNEMDRVENPILYVADLESYDQFNYLLTLLKSNARIVTTFTSEAAEAFFKNRVYYDLFNLIKISSTNRRDTLGILRNHINRFHASYSIEINETILEDIVEYSNLYLPDELQPQKAISLLEEICASIELKRLRDPEDVLHDLKVELDDLNRELDEISVKKQNAVKNQNYEEAAKYKNNELHLAEKLEAIRSEIPRKGKECRVRVKQENLIDAIHILTGIEKEKIKNKEKLIGKIKHSIRSEYSGLPQFEFLQTQSILHGHQISIKGGLAFVLIPHDREFDDLFYHYIKPSMEIHGLTVLKADNIFKPGNILSQVWAQIRMAEVIVVDVSGQNSNVIFELGLCYGIQRCPILLTRDPSELPFNIRNLRYIQYENTASGAHKLGEDLKIAVGEFLSAVRTDNY